MKKLFEEVQAIAKLDNCSISKALCKLAEEFGELAQAVNIKTGRKINLKYSDDDMKNMVMEESADVIQNVFYILQKFDISYEELIKSFELKNGKWQYNINIRNEKNGIPVNRIRFSKIRITPIENIKGDQIIDESKVLSRTHDTDMDVFTFHDTVHKHTRRSNLMDVSLYDDLIIENGIRYKILTMMTE